MCHMAFMLSRIVGADTIHCRNTCCLVHHLYAETTWGPCRQQSWLRMLGIAQMTQRQKH